MSQRVSNLRHMPSQVHLTDCAWVHFAWSAASILQAPPRSRFPIGPEFPRIVLPQAERRSLGVDVKACSRAASNVAQFRSSPSFGRSFEKRALTISTASA